MSEIQVESDDFKSLMKMVENGYRVTAIEISVYKTNDEFKEDTEVKLIKNHVEKTIVSSAPDFCNYVNHLHDIPQQDGTSQFVYIQNTNLYFEVQKKLLSIISDLEPNALVSSKILDSNLSFKAKEHLKNWIKEWVWSERFLNKFPTRLSRVFF